MIMLSRNKKIRTSSPSSSSSLIGHHQNKVLNIFDLLPEEVIIDQILLKLPVESLLSLRCVCKCLRSLIISPSFVQLHCTQQLPAAAVNDDVFNPAVAKLHFPLADIQASCNGLLYVQGIPICTMSRWTPTDYRTSPGYMYVYTTGTKNCVGTNTTITKSTMSRWPPTDHRISPGYMYVYTTGTKNDVGTNTTTITKRILPSYIWNPCTKEYKELHPPPPSKLLKEDQQVKHFDDQWKNFAILTDSSTCNDFSFCGFGYDCANDDYKLLYYENGLNSLEPISVPTAEFKVYSLRANTWKNISHRPYGSLYFGNRWMWPRIGLFVNGALHWIMSSAYLSRRATTAKIISFDIEKEVFTEIQKPPLLSGHEYYGDLQTFQGCLCVCQFPLPRENEEVDIWMLKDYTAKNSWTKFLKVTIRATPPFKEGLSIQYFKLLRYCENGEIAMLRNNKHLVLYHPFNHTVKRPTPAQNLGWMGMNYRKSLVYLNSGTYTS